MTNLAPFASELGGGKDKDNKGFLKDKVREKMKEQEKNLYSRKVTIRFKPDEYNQLEKKFKATTCRKLGDYIRKSSVGKPLVVTYRNQSAANSNLGSKYPIKLFTGRHSR